jgi:acetyltransferase-like isoleucine patch superfamily enzyme
MFDIPKKKALPYYDSRDFFDAVKNSSKKRKQSRINFLTIKLRNYILGLLAHTCPVNNLRVLFHRWRGVKIGKNVFIGFRCTLDHAYPEYIFLEDNVALAANVYINAHSDPSIYFRRKLMSYVAPVHVKKNAWLGINTTILPGVTIGEGAIITAGSVVSSDVPDDVIARGNPAEVIKKF